MLLALVFGIPLWALILVVATILGLSALVAYDRFGMATIVAIGTLITLQFVAGINLVEIVISHPLWIGIIFISYLIGFCTWPWAAWYFYLKNSNDLYEDGKNAFLKDHGVIGTKIPENLKEEFLADTCPQAYGNALQTFARTHRELGDDTLYRTTAKKETEEPQISEVQKEWRRIFGGDHFSSTKRIYVCNSRLPEELKVEFRTLLAGSEFKETIVPSAINNKARIFSWMVWWPLSAPVTLSKEPLKRAARLLFQAIRERFQKMSDGIFHQAINDDLIVKTDPK